jgi:drug/metabolite transporter (DMT)-like permease
MSSAWKWVLLTALALCAFAGNSVIGRIALGSEMLDPTSFTLIRLWSGALTLSLLITFQKSPQQHAPVSWKPSVALLVYAAAFSHAYQSLEAGTGAILLFGAVQLSAILISLIKGSKLTQFTWLGMTLAFAGFIYLMRPSVYTPDLSSSLLMLLAGIAWAIYTLFGSGSENPLADTASNFRRSALLASPLILIFYQQLSLSTEGFILACLSGSVTSGIGYAIWYRALSHLTNLTASVLQLTVPIIATLGGILFVDEKITTRFALCSIAILAGSLMVIVGQKKKPVSRDPQAS